MKKIDWRIKASVIIVSFFLICNFLINDIIEIEDYKKNEIYINFYKAYRAYVRAKVHYSTYLYSKMLKNKEYHQKNALKYLNLSKNYRF